MAAQTGTLLWTALLDAGARDVQGALFGAASFGHVPAAALVLARGADIHHLDDIILQEAVFLLDNGADLHAQNEFALRLAQRQGHAAVEALLLERAQA